MNLDTEFLEKLASAEPAPGGGGASAYAGALAAALAAMVGNLAVGKPKYADEQDGILASIDRLSQLRAKLLGLVAADADAYLPLNRAYRMPRGTEDEASIEVRLANARSEMAHAADYDVRIVNDDLARAVAELEDVIHTYEKDGGHAHDVRDQA